MNQFNTTNEIKSKFNITFNDKFNDIILLLFNKNIIPNTDDSNLLYIIGIYYYHIMDYDLMKKYYFMAIDMKNNDAMYKFGNYYEFIEKNYDNMKKYYLMAIDNGNTNAMINLGDYYEITGNKGAAKYYLMAFKKGDNNAYIKYINYLKKQV